MRKEPVLETVSPNYHTLITLADNFNKFLNPQVLESEKVFHTRKTNYILEKKEVLRVSVPGTFINQNIPRKVFYCWTTKFRGEEI